jgi:DNA-directed RNA polymerase subunit omega
MVASDGTKLDSDDSAVTMDRMTEEELLKGLEGLAPPEERPEPIEPEDDE